MVTVQRTKDAGWCAGLHAGLAVALGGKTPPKVEFGTWSSSLEPEAENRKSDTSAPFAPCKYRSEHGAGKAPVPARMRPSLYFTSGVVERGWLLKHPRK